MELIIDNIDDTFSVKYTIPPKRIDAFLRDFHQVLAVSTAEMEIDITLPRSARYEELLEYALLAQLPHPNTLQRERQHVHLLQSGGFDYAAGTPVQETFFRKSKSTAVKDIPFDRFYDQAREGGNATLAEGGVLWSAASPRGMDVTVWDVEPRVELVLRKYVQPGSKAVGLYNFLVYQLEVPKEAANRLAGIITDARLNTAPSYNQNLYVCTAEGDNLFIKIHKESRQETAIRKAMRESLANLRFGASPHLQHLVPGAPSGSIHDMNEIALSVQYAIPQEEAHWRSRKEMLSHWMDAFARIAAYGPTCLPPTLLSPAFRSIFDEVSETLCLTAIQRARMRAQFEDGQQFFAGSTVVLQDTKPDNFVGRRCVDLESLCTGSPAIPLVLLFGQFQVKPHEKEWCVREYTERTRLYSDGMVNPDFATTLKEAEALKAPMGLTELAGMASRPITRRIQSQQENLAVYLRCGDSL